MAQQLVMAFATSGLDAVIDAVAEGGAAMFEADTVVVMARYEMLLAGARDEAIGPLTASAAARSGSSASRW